MSHLWPVLFSCRFVALFTFPSEFKMMLKERASGMYRLSAFYFARTASDLPMELSAPSILIILIYFMVRHSHCHLICTHL